MSVLADLLTKVFRFLLFYPISRILGVVLAFRHFLYDHGWRSAYHCPVPAWGIGNLELGGSGKTPMADYLIRHFSQKYQIAYLSRGYGRISKGFLEVFPDTPADVGGDEVSFLLRKHPGKFRAFVAENRREGIEKIRLLFPGVERIIFDDIFQHRRVNPGKLILLTPFSLPFYRNHLFPSGSLRDLRRAWTRAGCLVFTRAPETGEHSLLQMKNQWPYGEERPFFTSVIRYGQTVNHRRIQLSPGQRVVCVAGIAHNKPFFDRCADQFSVERCISKPDHFRYSPDFFSQSGLSGKTILTTEKDFYKLLPLAPDPDLLFFLPIETDIYPEAGFLAWADEGWPDFPDGIAGPFSGHAPGSDS
jgi:tetraacyldisaccharide 4'-kinase